MTFFSDSFVCISTVCIKCVSKLSATCNKYTNVGKRCFNLNREANYRPQCAFDDSAEEGISVVMFAFLSIFSLGFLLLFIGIELTDRVVVLGFTPQN